MKQPREKGAFLRRCAGCGKRSHKSGLLRVVKTPAGEVLPDLTGKTDGRGAYLCRNADCLKNAVKTGRIAKTLKAGVPKSVYDKLNELIESGNE